MHMYAFRISFKATVCLQIELLSWCNSQNLVSNQINTAKDTTELDSSKRPLPETTCPWLICIFKFKQKHTDVYCPVTDNLAQNVQVDVLESHAFSLGAFAS